MDFRFYFETKGAHVHIRVFAASGKAMLGAKWGGLCMRVPEFEAFRAMSPNFSFVPEQR